MKTKKLKVKQLPSGSFRIQKMVDGKRYSITFDHEPTEKEVFLTIAKLIEQSDPCPKGSFEYYARKYLDSRSNVVSPNTIRTYEIKLNQLSTQFRSMDINKIDNDTVQKEINNFAADHAPKTVKTLHGYISSVLGAYRPNLRLKTKLPQAIKKDEYTPSSEDIRRIIKETEGTHFHVAFQLGVLSCRRGEICACTIEDLKGNDLWIHRNLSHDGTQWIVKESPKTDASNRIIHLPESLANEIREQGFIFDGHPNALNKAIHRIQKRLGIPEFKFHLLRSYFASYAHSIGISEADILSMGGWSTPHVMRSVYRKSMDESLRKSAELLNNSIIE